ncbi:MAG: sugar O-acetyltransferase, partial [Ruminococcus sp.]
MTEKDRMINGMLYIASDESIQSISSENKKLIDAFNNAKGEECAERMEYIKKAFAHTGKNAYIEPPFYCDHGWNISVGDNFYANTGVIILDQCPVTIGNNVMLAPRVSIYCACHPIDACVRNMLYELGKPVTIGNDVWIGGNTVINPGVTIGN